MKCPKCGSEDIGTYFGGDYPYCKTCKYEFTQDEIFKVQYQQKLSKVLEKFENKSLIMGLMCSIEYYKNKFYLQANDVDLEISLNTVEHLIKDMEMKL